MSKNLLGEYIAELTDFTANGSFADLRENVKYYNEYNYAALVRTTDLDKYNFQPEVFTDKNGYEFLVKSRLFGGEIIVANVGSVGKVFKVPYYSLPMTLGPNAYLVRFDKDKIDQEYAYQFLISDFFKTELYRKIGSTTLQAINKDNFRSIELFVPNDINNQQRIAKILSTADAVIEKTQAAIAKYKAIKQGMLQDLFTRGIDLNTNKLRPRYEDAPELYKESKLGMIPREWEVEVLSSIIEIISGGTPSTHVKEYWNGEIPWLSVDDFNTGNRYALNAAKHITQLGLENSASNYLLPGMLIISARGTVGVISQMKFPMTFNQSCYGLNSINKALSNDFLYYFLLYFKQHIGFNAFGGVFDAITKKTFDEIFIPLNNSSNEHQLIIERLTVIDTKLQTEQAYLQKMQMVKKGLMEDLLSGRKCLNLDFQDEQINQDSKTILQSVNRVNQDADNYPVNPKIE